MPDIIQIYRSKISFAKQNYTSENRKQFEQIKDSFISLNGYVKDNTLYLPEEYKSQTDLKTADLILLQDIDGFNPFLMEQHKKSLLLYDSLSLQRKERDDKHELIFYFRQPESPKAFELFKIAKTQQDCYELFLNYTSHKLAIGIPERQNHKFGVLNSGKGIRYKINGKSDFTMTWRKERSFYEYDYIFEFIGSVDKIEFLPLNRIETEKQIPLKQCKLIDERKILR